MVHAYCKGFGGYFFHPILIPSHDGLDIHKGPMMGLVAT